jgi:hypothetical protein
MFTAHVHFSKTQTTRFRSVKATCIEGKIDGKVEVMISLDYVVTISFGYILYCVCYNFYCGGFILFCNVCVCVCVCVGVCVCM